MTQFTISQLVDRFGIISDQVGKAELVRILEEFGGALAQGVDGAVVEFGCYTGTTSLFIRRLLNQANDRREFHVYDSFEGLPPKSAEDQSPAGEQFKAGELSASRKEFTLNFKRAGLALPVVHKGWFNQLSGEDVPSPIAFAFLDGDYYGSITDSLRLIWPRLAPHAVVVVDDYMNEALPGAARAVDQWLVHHPVRLTPAHSLAIIHT